MDAVIYFTGLIVWLFFIAWALVEIAHWLNTLCFRLWVLEQLGCGEEFYAWRLIQLSWIARGNYPQTLRDIKARRVFKNNGLGEWEEA